MELELPLSEPDRIREDAEDDETRVRVCVERWRGTSKIAAHVTVGLLRVKRQSVAQDLDVAGTVDERQVQLEAQVPYFLQRLTEIVYMYSVF